MLKIVKIYKDYPNFELECSNLEFSEAGLFILKGPSGSGKSTFLNILAKKDKEYLGYLEGNEHLSYYSKNRILNSNKTFLETLAIYDNLNLNTISFLLQSFSLLDKVNCKVDTLSLGEKQRLELIISLSKEEEIYLLDEPTSALDAKNVKILLDYLKELAKYRLIIVATHSNKFDKFANGQLDIENGKIHLNNIKENKRHNNFINLKKPFFFNLKVFKNIVFNKFNFLLNIFNLIIVFSMSFFSFNLERKIKNVLFADSYKIVKVSNKFINDNKSELKEFLVNENLSYDLEDNIIIEGYFTYSKLEKWQKEYPNLLFDCLEKELIDCLMEKMKATFDKYRTCIKLILVISILNIFIDRCLELLINEKKVRNFKENIKFYKRYKIVYFSFFIIVVIIFSLIGEKFLNKKILNLLK